MCFVGLRGPLPGVSVYFTKYNEMKDFLNRNCFEYKNGTILKFYVLETDYTYDVKITINDYIII